MVKFFCLTWYYYCCCCCCYYYYYYYYYYYFRLLDLVRIIPSPPDVRDSL